MLKKAKSQVKVNGYKIGGSLFGVNNWSEGIPNITYPRKNYKKQEIPERFLPNYIEQKENHTGSMILVINTVGTEDTQIGRTSNTVFFESVIRPLSETSTIEIEFMERQGILYICTLASGVTVENLLNVKNAYKYTIDLEIQEVKTRGS